MHGFAERRFRFVPIFGGADVFVAGRVAQRQAHPVVVHAKRAQDLLHQIEATGDFRCHLLGRAEQVGVVLGEPAHPGHAAEFAGLLPAIDGAELGQPNRKVAVRMVVAGEDPDVVRAVHRLEQVALVGSVRQTVDQGGATRVLVGEFFQHVAFGDGRVLAFLIVREMAGRAVEVEFADVRSEHLRISLFVEFRSDELLQRAAHQRAFRFPQHQPLAHHLVDVKQAHLPAKSAVVALLRLLQAVQVFL